ncbi:MAG: flagellar hook-basal body complex protein, partial [Clostridiales bacterium]|nr:flagellar hook-basal body complex protein [Clostridiales bacterium]
NTTDAEFSMPMTVYDSLGNNYEVNVYFAKASATATGSTWSYYIPSLTATTDTPQGYDVDTTSINGTLQFDVNGALDTSATSTTSTPNLIMTPNPDNGADTLTITLDFSSLTSYAADSSAKPTSIDGYTTGTLTTFNIGSDGIITGVYSNGQQQPLGLLGMASFSNPSGLQKVGDNMYLPTTNSGSFEKAVKAGSEGVGTLSPGTLEMSNVDLSSEFTNMIITQRGFQANSRIITTSDEMLQELVNLKR